MSLGFLAIVVALLAACSGGSESATDTTAAGIPGPRGTITVSAAASLTGSFEAIGKDYETKYPGTKVAFNFDSSGALSNQIAEGAPADVFASADAENMTVLFDAGLLGGDPATFASNRLAIVTKPGNPSAVHNLDDLAKLEVVALCAPTAPCGRLADGVLDQAGVEIPEDHVTRGQNVKATLAAVTEGDADAGIVYITDAKASGGSVATVEIPDDANATTDYPVAVVGGSDDVDLARKFIDYLMSTPAQTLLAEAGFGPPG